MNNTDIDDTVVSAAHTGLDAEIIRRASARTVAGGVAVAIPEGMELRDIRLLGEAPTRRAEEVRLLTLDQFAAYTRTRYKEGESVIFVSKEKAKAVFDYCGPDGEPRWQTDMARFGLEHCKDWENWKSNSGQWMPQAKFLEFLEDNLGTIIQPSGADFYNMARDFRAQRNVEYTSSYRTSDGQTCLVYNEVNKGQQCEMSVPDMLTLQVSIVRGAEEHTTYEVKARIRTHIGKDDHKLSFRYELIRPEVPEDNAVHDIREVLEKAGFKVFEGTLFYNNYESFSKFADNE